MDTRTMIRELDEVIARVQSAAKHEASLIDALPECGLRRNKAGRLRTMRAHLHQLQGLRAVAKTRRRPGSPLY